MCHTCRHGFGLHDLPKDFAHDLGLSGPCFAEHSHPFAAAISIQKLFETPTKIEDNEDKDHNDIFYNEMYPECFLSLSCTVLFTMNCCHLSNPACSDTYKISDGVMR